MLRIIVLIALLANSNFASEDSASALTSSSSKSSSHVIYNHEDQDECEDKDEESITPETPTEPEQPSTTPEEPTTTPEQPNTTPDQEPGDNEIENFTSGVSKFNANFFFNVVKANPNKSVTMSPFSSMLVFAPLVFRTPINSINGEQMMNALNLKRNEIAPVISAILSSIHEQKNVTFTMASKIYGNNKNSFSDQFKTETKDILGAEAESISFVDLQEAADTINKWVADNTNNKITDLIPKSLLTPNTELVLVNALYCFGEWRNKFDPNLTSKKEFYVSENETVMVDTMTQVKYFRYAETDELNAQVLELPYVNQNMTFMIILPREKNGTTNIVSKLVDIKVLNSIQSNLRSTKVAVSLPKFGTKTTIDLKELFQKLNLNAMFDPKLSSLEGILTDPRTLFISAGIQKADIVVNEVGSEAAAANAIIGVATSAIAPTPPIPFTANRPFIYYLLFRGYPIFCGLYAGN